MLFNPDISKQAVEVIFSNKGQKTNYPPLVFNGIPVKLVEETKHLGMILDSKLNFQSHLSEKIAKANSGLGVMIQLKKWVSYKVLEVVYKLYVRPHLDYGDVIYHFDNPNKNPNKDPGNVFEFEPKNHLMEKVEEVQYNAAKIITGAWQGSSKKNFTVILDGNL